MLLTRALPLVPCALLGLLLAPAIAYAQPVGLLIQGEPTPVLEKQADAVRQALTDRGLSVVAGDGLDTLLRAAGFEPYEEPAEWSAELQQASAQALEDAAFGRFDRVRASADAQIARAEGVLAWLGTRPELTTQLGDLCLYAVRAELRMGLGPEARARTAHCLRVAPSFTPSADVHPESVIETFAAAREAMRTGPLLELQPDAHISACELRLQGVPTSDSSHRHAGAYVASLSCSGPGGWALRFQLPEEGLQLRVPVALLHGLGTDGRRAYVLQRADAVALARALDDVTRVQAWVVVDAGANGNPRLRYLTPQDDPLRTRAEVTWQGDAAATVEALLGSDEPSTDDKSEAETRANSIPPTALAPRAGWALAASAVAVAGGAGGLYGGWLSRDATLRGQSPALTGTPNADPAYLKQLDDRDRLGAWSSALSGLASALAISAVPLLTQRPRARKVWPWILGAVGAGLVATGGWVLSRGNQSETLPDGRTRTTPVVPLAPLLLSQGLSLMIAPTLSETGQQSRTSRAHFGISGYF